MKSILCIIGLHKWSKNYRTALTEAFKEFAQLEDIVSGQIVK